MTRFRDLLSSIAAALRAVAGVPDYDRYAAHMRLHHPETPPLPLGDWFARRQRDRFERPGGKCC